MELNQFVDEQTLAALKRLLPNFTLQPVREPIVGSKHPSVSIELPAPAGADYLFKLYFQPEKQIHARLLKLNGEAHYFWYRPFEDAEFGNSTEKLDRAFIEAIENLIANETRIIQRRGLLSHSFRCEFKSPSGWKRVYGHLALRFGRRDTPPIDGRVCVYHSPALEAR